MSHSSRSPNWIIFLGTGTGIVNARRSASSILIGNSEFACLVDCGPGTLLRLGECGHEPCAPAAILFTHYHLDHCADLAPLLFARRIRRCPTSTSEPLQLFGSGVQEYYEGLHRLYGSWVEPQEGLPRPIELEEAVYQVGPWTVEWCRTNHSENSVAYRFEDGHGGSLVISGDTGYSPDLIELSRNADTLVLECAFPDPSPLPIHLSPITAGELAAAAGVRRLILTHFYPETDLVDVLGSVGKTYKGPAIVGEDLLQLTW